MKTQLNEIVKTIYDIEIEFNKELELLRKAKTVIINVRSQAQISECYPNQQLKRHGRESLRCWRQGRRNGHLSQKKKNHAKKKIQEISGIP